LSQTTLRKRVEKPSFGRFVVRRFYLHTRHNGIFYAELVDPLTGQKLIARSTGTRNRDEAMLKVAEWLKFGVPTGFKRKLRPIEAATGLEAILKAIKKTDLNADDAIRIVTILKERELIDIPVVKAGKGSVSFLKFLEEFWDYGRSPYVREKLAHGHSIGKRHCYESMSRFHTYWEPAFKGRILNSITKQDLKDFSLSLSDKKPAPSSINKTMAVGTTALVWAFKEGKIAVDPTAGLINFSGETKKRGVLTPQEAAAIFAAKWKDKRAYVGNLLACTTGLRSGEVLALRLEDIGEQTLNVCHSWSDFDGLKTPKTGNPEKFPYCRKFGKNFWNLPAKTLTERKGLFSTDF
jgi:hypothetical protein